MDPRTPMIWRSWAVWLAPWPAHVPGRVYADAESPSLPISVLCPVGLPITAT